MNPFPETMAHEGAAPLKCNNPVGDYWEGGQPNIYVITLPFFTTARIFAIEKSRQETREFEQVTTMSPVKNHENQDYHFTCTHCGEAHAGEASASLPFKVWSHLLGASQVIGHSKRSVRLRQ